MLATKEKRFVLTKNSQFDNKTQTEADHTMREQDRVKRWKKVHDLLRKHNKKARREQDTTAKDAKYFRDNKLIKKDKSEIMGLRWGVALPPITYKAIVQSDRLIFGRCDLSETDKEAYTDPRATNQLVKDLEKAFPMYRVS